MSDEEWEGFFRSLGTAPLDETVGVKCNIAGLFEREYDVRKKDCLEAWLWEIEGEVSAPSEREETSPAPSPSPDKPSSTAMMPYPLSPPASQPDVEVEVVDVKGLILRLVGLPPVEVDLIEQEDRMDEKIDAMFERVRKYKKEKVCASALLFLCSLVD